MKYSMYCVQDTIAGFAARPFMQKSDVVAIRSFKQAVQDPGTDINKNPADFNLMHIGFFDDETCILESSTPRALINGAQLKE